MYEVGQNGSFLDPRVMR